MKRTAPMSTVTARFFAGKARSPRIVGAIPRSRKIAIASLVRSNRRWGPASASSSGTSSGGTSIPNSSASRPRKSVASLRRSRERRHGLLRSMRAQEQFALPPVHEVAAIRVRTNRGITIRERLIHPAEACVKVRLQEKRLVTRCHDSGEDGKGIVGSGENLQGARKFGVCLGGAEFRGLSE